MDREKIGECGIDWKEHAFGRGKYRRKTFPFFWDEEADKNEKQVHIRETSIVDAGIGCGVWDASIIFSRWVVLNREKFRDKFVLELGSGCGLTGLVAARFAKKVVLSDYILNLLENLQYNIDLNRGIHSPDPTDPSHFLREPNTSVLFLDWDLVVDDGYDISNPPLPKEKDEDSSSSSSSSPSPSPSPPSPSPSPSPSSSSSSSSSSSPAPSSSSSSSPSSSSSEAVDLEVVKGVVKAAIVKSLNQAAKVVASEKTLDDDDWEERWEFELMDFTEWTSDLGDELHLDEAPDPSEFDVWSINATLEVLMNYSNIVSHVWKNMKTIQHSGGSTVLLQEEEEEKDFQTRMSPFVYGIPKVDIILGSELTYNTLSITTVPKVIQKFLSPQGVFYEILSDDRDGVGSFLVEMENCGFSVSKERVSADLLGNYGTKQRNESYHFYTFKWEK